jgi:putative ABC transport system permease protein
MTNETRRAALGASRRDVIGLVLRTGLLPAIVGLAAGLITAMLFAPTLSGLLFGVAPRDGASLAISLATLAAAVLFANVVPAQRAVRIDPIVALRIE